jgi:hypothetical protein
VLDAEVTAKGLSLQVRASGGIVMCVAGDSLHYAMGKELGASSCNLSSECVCVPVWLTPFAWQPISGLLGLAAL